MIEFLDALGANILRSLAAVRAGLVIAAVAFLELAIRAANQAERLTGFLKPFFEFLTVVFGVLSALVAAMFVIRQFRLMSERSPKD